MRSAQALTSRTTGGGRRNAIITQVVICLPFPVEPGIPVNIEVKQFAGVWDTGATASVISPNVARELGLQPTGQTRVNTAGGEDIQNTYLVNLTLPMGFIFPNLVVTEGKLAGVDVLIGMDIIGLGDFAITNFKGETVMTFRIPSMEEFDFVPEANSFNIKMQKREIQAVTGQRVQPRNHRKGSKK